MVITINNTICVSDCLLTLFILVTHIRVIYGCALCTTCDVINLNVTSRARIDLSAQQSVLDIDGILIDVAN